MDDDQIESSPEDDFRRGVAHASMDVMDAITAQTGERVIGFYNEASLLIESLVEGGLTLKHAAQIMVSYATGCALDHMQEGD